MSGFHLKSLLVIPEIDLNTSISKLNIYLCFPHSPGLGSNQLKQ